MFRGKGAFEGAERLAKNSVNFKNEICAGFLVMPQAKDPLKVAGKVNVPVLMLVCLYDEIVSPKSYVKMAELLGNLVEIKKYPIGHFDIYESPNFDIAVKDQLDFLKRVLN